MWQERPCTGKGGQGVLSVSVPGILSSLPEHCREGQEKKGGRRRRRQRTGEEGGGEEGGEGRGGGKRKEERRGGGRREKGSREAEEGSPQQRAGVTLGQCPPVPGSGFKIAVVSFVQHEKEPQQSAAGEVGGGGK